MTINEVVICGRLARDPELKYTQGGTAVVSSAVALDRYIGEGKDNDTDFVPVVAWGKQAEFLSKYFFKGKKIIVKGNLKTRTWEDQNGNKRFTMEVWAEKIDFADDKKQDESQQTQRSDPKRQENKNTQRINDKNSSTPPWMRNNDKSF